jgi:hypothetical protein
MFVSTREMLGQITASRSSAETAIEKCYGPNCDWSGISGDPAISSTLQKFGLDAFSDDALQHIVSVLSNRRQQEAEVTGEQV